MIKDTNTERAMKVYLFAKAAGGGDKFRFDDGKDKDKELMVASTEEAVKQELDALPPTRNNDAPSEKSLQYLCKAVMEDTNKKITSAAIREQLMHPEKIVDLRSKPEDLKVPKDPKKKPRSSSPS